MGSSYNKDFYHVCLPWLREPDSEEIVELLEAGRSTIWQPFSVDSEELCKYLVDADEGEFENVEYDVVVEDVARAQEGFVELATENTTFTLRISDSFEDYGYEDLGGACVTWNWSVLRDQEPTVIDDIVRVVTFVYEMLPVAFAFSQIPAEWEREVEVTGEDIERRYLSDVFWLTIFSPPQSKEIGCSRLSAGSIWRTDQLADGSTLLVSTPHPFEYSRSVKEEIGTHLGLADQDC